MPRSSMPPSNFTYAQAKEREHSVVRNYSIEFGFIDTPKWLEYDMLLCINGVPCGQSELKTLGTHPRRAMEQIVQYKYDCGKGDNKPQFCLLKRFIITNRDRTCDVATLPVNACKLN